MDPTLFFKTPPPIDPAWLVHEKTATFLATPAHLKDPKERQAYYAQKCNELNTQLLSGRDSHLTKGIKIFDTNVGSIPIRSYVYIPDQEGSPPTYSPKATSTPEPLRLMVVYYHGGGLYVGDIDSEDLSCRRICKELQCTVYSVQYRLLPEFTADDALADALAAFQAILSLRQCSRLIIMGSSSGGELAAQVSQRYIASHGPQGNKRIHGVLLRCPVTCDATHGGENLGEKFRAKHMSMNEAFHTSMLASAALNARNRSTSPLPLEAENFSKLPRHWIQVTTNDIYYSDGLLYADALKEAGVEVKLDVVRGWPHTFWLKAPFLDRAVQADKDMVEGLKWLIESEPPVREQARSILRPEPAGGFVPFTDEGFERKFNDV